MAARKHSALFRHIEALQGDRPWGTFLDAGTGIKSIRWVTDLNTERWTAVTGARGDAAKVEDDVKAVKRPGDRVILGNWARADLLKDEVYDTVLVDYLLGAVEGFAPYFQSYLFARLRPLTGRVLYMTGLEPYVPASRPDDTAERLIWEIGRHRDACLLLGGEMPYREYPSVWAVDNLKRAGFAVTSTKRFAIRYKQRFVNTQIDLCQTRLDALEDQAVADALRVRGETLRAEALAHIDTHGALAAGHDYVIAAEPI